VPSELRQGAAAVFAGRYDDALRVLDPLNSPDKAVATQVHLFRAAARYALYLKGGERETALEARALEDVTRLRELAPALEPDVALFSPRFREFVSRAR
jgi:hypothetical protein